MSVAATVVPSSREASLLPAADANATASVALRIMPLGASVTWGVGSTTGSSYRKDLRDLLVAAGNTVDMVGEVKHGSDFTDNESESFSGYTLEQIAEKAAAAVPKYKPNLVLIDAGTNNCNRGGTVADLGRKMTALLEGIFAASKGASVVLATILANPDAKQDACRVDANRQYAALVEDLAAKGRKVVLADMRSAQAPTTRDLADGRHPNDAGYAKMASVWFQGIQLVISKGLLAAAEEAT